MSRCCSHLPALVDTLAALLSLVVSVMLFALLIVGGAGGHLAWQDLGALVGSLDRGSWIVRLLVVCIWVWLPSCYAAIHVSVCLRRQQTAQQIVWGCSGCGVARVSSAYTRARGAKRPKVWVRVHSAQCPVPVPQ
jgi:hypothetical protein